MSDVKINFAGIEEAISSMTMLSSNYSDLLKSALGLHNEVISEWEGSAAKAWDASVRSYISKGNMFVDAINSFRKYTESVVNDFKTLDSECAALINNSF